MITDLAHEPPERHPSPRTEAMDERILEVAVELLRSRGSIAVNMESVAAESGVAKTTLYRRYADRAALLRATIESASTAVDVPAELSSRDLFRWLLVQARSTIEQIVGRGTVAAILTEEDPEFTELLRGMVRARARGLSATVAARIQAGELRADLDFGLLSTVLLGAALGQEVRGYPLDEAWADQVIELLWPVIKA